jgi:osmotically-inducible protein OsmY
MSLIRNLCFAAMLGATLSTGCTAIGEKEPKEVITDAAIEARAKAMFTVDPIVKARNIKVTAVKGVVTLSGVVKSDEEAARAVELVSGIKGVDSVVTALQVIPR